MSVMKIFGMRLFHKFKKYHFELRHLMVVFSILVVFQLAIQFTTKIELRKFLSNTQELYQRDFAERVANLTAASLELLLETSLQDQNPNEEIEQKLVQSFNIILSQQLLQQHVTEVCILLSHHDRIFAVDNGKVLYSYIYENLSELPNPVESHARAISMYESVKNRIRTTEQTYSLLEDERNFHVFVPFVPKGEYIGVLYMLSSPEFGFLTSGIISGYNETGMIYTAFIFFGLLAMFYIASYTVKERDATQQLLFKERERKIK